MRLPTYDELASVEEQLDVLRHPLDRPLFVVGPPGSGKTVLALQRAQAVAKGVEEPAVDLITYNRMLRRLLDLLKDGDGVRPRTMQSFIWRDYRQRTGVQPPRHQHDPYSYQWADMLDRLEQDQDRSHSGDKPHLIVDEGQDLAEGFFRYIHRVAQVVSVFADENQALRESRTTLEQIKAAAGLGDPIILGKNHRNTPEIARLAEYFHSGRLPAAEVRRASAGELPRLVRQPDVGATADLISSWHGTRGGSIGVIVDRNETGATLQSHLADRLSAHTRIDLYKNQSGNEDEIDVRQDGVTILNKESVKGQEFDTVFILELDRFVPCTSDMQRRIMYMMCTRARHNLFLIHSPGTLSSAASASLPGAALLEQS